MRPKKLLQCIKCGGNSFSLRYFYILILFVHTRSSSLSLEIFGSPPRLPKYLLDQHSPYPKRITSSDCTLPTFPMQASILGPIWSFAFPQTYPYYQIGLKAQYKNLGHCPRSLELYFLFLSSFFYFYFYFYFFVCWELEPDIA